MKEIVLSPISGLPATLIETYDKSKILSCYKNELNFDVAQFIDDIEQFHLFRCNETGYKFYHPQSLVGSTKFYDDLYSNEQHQSWSYIDNRWEFEFLSQYLQENDSILDIGCGSGLFLEKIKHKFKSVNGIETNPYGLKALQEKGIQGFNESIEEHALNHEEQYDCVTTLQVLEHVYDVKTFLAASVKVLKPGGILAIAVPNDDSFVGRQDNLPLNMPPHHVSLWTPKNLWKLQEHFPISCIYSANEPLQENIMNWYQAYFEKSYIAPKGKVTNWLYYKLGFHKIFQTFLSENRMGISGHTTLAIFQKND